MWVACSGRILRKADLGLHGWEERQSSVGVHGVHGLKL